MTLMAFISVYASAYDFCVDGIYYTKHSDGTTCEVARQGANYYPYTGDVTIPSTVTYDGTTYNVTAIGYGAFWGCRNLTSVTIPNSVTSIGELAFGSTNLTSITLPSDVTSIGKNAFADCSKLTSINIPSKVTSIGEYTFQRCTSLKRIYCEPTTPPTLASTALDGIGHNVLVYLPNGGEQGYVTDEWLENMKVTVSAAGWASGCLSYPAQVPYGTAYYISKITANEATLTEFPEGKIPYNTGFLYKHSAGTHTFSLLNENPQKPDDMIDILKGTVEDMTVAANSIYVLGKDNAGKVGIRLYTGTSLSGNKAYINVADIPSGTVNAISFDFDGGTSGITESVVTATGSDKAPVYNLQGQRVTTPRSGQIYIQNGKKIIK